MFSQENIFEKSMSFFGSTKHGKISKKKNQNQNCKKKNKILFEIKHWIHLIRNWKTIPFQLFVWPEFSCKWPKNWCLPIHIYLYLYVYQIDILWSENDNNGLNNRNFFRVKVSYFKSKLRQLEFQCTHGMHN